MAKNTTVFNSYHEIFNRLFDIENNRLDFSTPKSGKISKFSIFEIINRCFDPVTNTLDINILGNILANILANINTDTTLSENSDTEISSQKAIKTYVDDRKISPFVTTNNAHFYLKGQEFKFVGGSDPYLMRDSANKGYVRALLDACQNAGITVFRTFLDPAAAIPSFLYPLGTNILTDPGFETDPVVAGWSYPANFTWSTDTARTGTHSLKLVGNSGDYPTASKQITVLPNTLYHVTYWYKLASTPDGNGSHFTPSVNVGTGTGGGAAYDRVFGNYDAFTTTSDELIAAGYVQKQISFNSGANTTLYINLISWGGVNSAYYDDFTVSVDLGTAPTIQYNDLVMKNIDYVMDEVRKRGIKLQLSLVDGTTNNTLNKGWYINAANLVYGHSYSTSYPYLDFQTSADVCTLYDNFFDVIANRENSINGLIYKEDPTIFGWEIGNELTYENGSDSGINTLSSTNLAIMSGPGGWIQKRAQHIKSVDSNHMVTFGDSGHSWHYANIGADQDVIWNGTSKGISYELIAQIPELDYGGFHMYPNQNNGNGFGFKVSPTDIRGWGYGLGFVPLSHNVPSAAGFRGQLADFVNTFHSNGKPVVWEETGLEAAYAPTGDYPLNPRAVYYTNVFHDFFDVLGGDGIFPWTVAAGTSNGGFFAIALGATGGELDTTNVNDTNIVKLFRKYGNKFNANTIKSELPVTPPDQILSSSGTISLDLTIDKILKQTPTGNSTFNATSVGLPGKTLTFVITTSGTTSYTLTFGTGFKSTGTLATGTVTAKVFTVTFVSDGINYLEVSRTTAL